MSEVRLFMTLVVAGNTLGEVEEEKTCMILLSVLNVCLSSF
jgi:hypothetical protein